MTIASGDEDAADVPVIEVPRRSALARNAAIVIAVLVVALVAVLATRDTQRNRDTSQFIIGEVAPQLTGQTLDGSTIDIDDLRNRWVVLNFFATWCVGCVEEHPELVEFETRHPDGDAVLVSVAFQNSRNEIVDFFEEHGGAWPVLVENTGETAIDYSVTAVPETVIVGPNGVVFDKLLGGVTADGIDERIELFAQAARS